MQEHWGIASSHQVKHPPPTTTTSLAFKQCFWDCGSRRFSLCPLSTSLYMITTAVNKFFFWSHLIYALGNWGFGPTAETPPIGCSRMIERWHSQAAIGSWNLLIRLHQSLSVGWLWKAAKSMLSILRWHYSPRPKRLKILNVSVLVKNNTKQKKKASKQKLIFFFFANLCFIAGDHHNLLVAILNRIWDLMSVLFNASRLEYEYTDRSPTSVGAWECPRLRPSFVDLVLPCAKLDEPSLISTHIWTNKLSVMTFDLTFLNHKNTFTLKPASVKESVCILTVENTVWQFVLVVLDNY